MATDNLLDEILSEEEIDIIELRSVCDFSQKGVIQIEDELIKYEFASDYSLVNLTRGYNSTTPAEHPADSVVEFIAELGIIDVKLRNDAVIITGTDEPVDAITGDDVAGTGSLFIDVTNADLWINTGTKEDPTWVKMAKEV